MNLDLAISPCPNDTFIFHKFSNPGFTDHTIRLVLEDVEELNRRAIEEQRHEISKLSYFAIALLQSEYRLLDAGGALGRGCGPILITGPDHKERALEQLTAKAQKDRIRILIPGRYTTANLLLHLFLNESGIDLDRVNFIPERYDRILSKLRSGEESYGVIIHEERFTYQGMGLFPVRDMGDWWESHTGLPIPLGGIAIRKDIPSEVADHIEQKIKASLAEVRRDITPAWDFIKKNAQALEDEVIRSHIDLYVNDYSLDPGEEGKKAIRKLFELAQKASIT